jgi:hypothetical protein
LDEDGSASRFAVFLKSKEPLPFADKSVACRLLLVVSLLAVIVVDGGERHDDDANRKSHTRNGMRHLSLISDDERW